jgi:uncharacterized membrane protein YoaK (UPF0700 family)
MVLYEDRRLVSPRQTLTWVLLAFSAGGVNAIAFAACQRFVTHVTGTVTLLGSEIRQPTLVLDYALVIGCFVLGAMASVLLINGRHYRGKTPLYWAPLSLVALVLAMVGVLGVSGTFGGFGGRADSPDFLLLSLVSFAMGHQNAAVGTTTALAVRTTHMSGPATDLGVSLATCFYTAGEARARALRLGLLRFGKLISFAAGAVAMLPLTPHVGYAAFFLPAALTVLAIALSFAPWAVRRPQLAPELSPLVAR